MEWLTLITFPNSGGIGINLLQVTPLNWLEAWLDNMMASVPGLAIYFHQNGDVQGYELLKPDNIFHSKGLSEDGSPFFLS
jgi:hypothetical protein